MVGNIKLSRKVSESSGEIFFEENFGDGILAIENIIINDGNIDINLPQTAFESEKEIIINSGKLNITSKKTAINANGLFNINGGILDISATETGIYIRSNELKILGGKIHIKTESGPAIYLKADKEVTFELADYLKILEEELDIRSNSNGHIKAIGILPSNEALQNDETFLDEMAKEVTIDYIYKEHKFLDNTEKIEEISGQVSNISFRIDAKKENFKWIKIGGILLEDDDYLLTDGSTVITLTEKGLNKINNLEAGIYDVEINFASAPNTSKGTLILAAAEIPEEENNTENKEKNEETNQEISDTSKKQKNPKTGDSVIYALVLLLVSSFGIIILKKEK